LGYPPCSQREVPGYVSAVDKSKTSASETEGLLDAAYDDDTVPVEYTKITAKEEDEKEEEIPYPAPSKKRQRESASSSSSEKDGKEAEERLKRRRTPKKPRTEVVQAAKRERRVVSNPEAGSRKEEVSFIICSDFQPLEY